MAPTTFSNGVTLTDADWFNDVDALIYDVFNEKTSAGTSGTILRSNGTNIVNTTATYPTTITANQVLYATGANAIGSGANLTFDGSTLTVTGALSVTGNTTLGDAVGDTVRINAGTIGIGAAATVGTVVHSLINPTGDTTTVAFRASGTVQSDVTTAHYGHYSDYTTAAASFTLASMIHYSAHQTTAIGAGSTVTTQTGFQAASTLTGATNNYGFRGLIASGANRYNLFMDGTAANYAKGTLILGSSAASLTGGSDIEVSSDGSVGSHRFDIMRWTADASGYAINFLKSRGATAGTFTATQSGDIIGSISFNAADDGSGSETAARIQAVVDGTPGTGDMPGALQFATTPDGSATVIQRVKIGNQGNVILNNSGSALATNATGGFTYLPSCAGTPTGVPAVTPTGAVAVVIDSTNNKLYFYSGGSWRDAGP